MLLVLNFDVTLGQIITTCPATSPGTIYAASARNNTVTIASSATATACYWIIDCPAATFVHIDQVSSHNNRNTNIQFIDYVAGQIMATLLFGATAISRGFSKITTPANQMQVTVSGAPRNTALFLNTTCAPSYVNDTFSCPVGKSLSADGAFFGSDFDGEGPINTYGTCSWLLSCGAGQHIQIDYYRGSNAETTLRLDDPARSSKTIGVVDFSQAAVATKTTTTSLRAPMRQASIVLAVAATAEGSFSQGFSMATSCVPAIGVLDILYDCPNDNRTLPAAGRTIGSDLDGRGPVNAFGQCMWTLTCDDGQFVRFDFFTSRNINTNIFVMDPISWRNVSQQYYPNAMTSRDISVPTSTSMQSVTVLFDGRDTRSEGFTLNTSCVDAVPEDEILFSCPINRSLAAANRTFGTDIDGAGPYQILGTCQWLLSCNASTEFVRIVFVTGTNYNTRVNIVPAGSSKAVGLIYFSGTRTLSNLTIPSAAVDISFTSSDGRSQGMNVTTTCVPNQPVDEILYDCPANRLLSAANRTLGSDVDGAGPFNVLGTCSWILFCPPGEFVYINNFTGTNAASAVRFADAATNEEVALIYYAGLSPRDISDLSTPFTNVTVRFTSNSVSSQGFTMNTTCVNFVREIAEDEIVYDCPVNRTITAHNRRVGTDFDGSGPVNIQGTCKWNLFCNESQVVKIVAYAGINEITDVYFGDALLGGRSFARLNYPTRRLPSWLINDVTTSVQNITILFNSADDASDGFTIDTVCVPAVDEEMRFGCPVERNMTADNRTFGTDLDGDGWIYPPQNTNCSWNLYCEGPNEVVRIVALNISAIDADLIFVDPTDAEVGRMVFPMTSLTTTQLNDAWTALRNMTVRYVGRTGFSRGFTMRTICVPNEDQLARFSTPTNRTVSARGQTIGSDLDGAGATVLTPPGTSRWNLYCDVGEVVRIVSFTANLTNSNVTFADFNEADRVIGSMPFTVPSVRSFSNANTSYRNLSVILTISSATSRGFTMVTDCIAATEANMVYGSPSNRIVPITTQLQQIGSDLDGSASFVNPPIGTSRWTLACGEDQLLQLASFGSICSSSTIEFLDPQQQLIGTITYPVGGMSRTLPLLNTSYRNVTIVFTNGGATSMGFFLTASCVPQSDGKAPFGSPHQTRVVNIPPTGETVTVASDLDGTGAVVNPPVGSPLFWSFICPSNYLLNFVSVTSASMNATVTYYDESFDLIGSSVHALTLSTIPVASRSMMYRNVTIVYTNNGAQSSGVTMVVSCVAESTQNAQFGTESMRTVVVGSPSSQRFGSDVDGHLGNVRTPVGNYSWLLRCFTEGVVNILRIDANSGNANTIVFTDPTTSALIGNMPLAGSVDVSLGAVKTQYNEILMSLNVTSSTSGGVTVTFQCLVNNDDNMWFGSPFTPRTVSASPMSIGSDLDGVGGVVQPPVGTMQWRLQCAVNFTIRIDTIRGTFSSGDVVFTDLSAANRTVARLVPAITLGTTITSYRALGVAYTNQAGTASGFSLNATCISAIPNPNPVYGCPSNMTLSVAGGKRIGSDFDGETSTVLAPPGDCRWTLQCPSHQSVRIASFRGTSPNGHLHFTIPSQDDRQLARFGFSSSAAALQTFATGVTIPHSAVSVVFATTATTARGFQLQADCVSRITEDQQTNGCPSNLTIYAARRRIGTDFDGSASQISVGATPCRWNLYCNGNRTVFLKTLTSTMANTSIDFLGTNGTLLRALTYLPSGQSRTSPLNFSVSHMSVVVSSPFGNSAGASMEFECFPDPTMTPTFTKSTSHPPTQSTSLTVTPPPTRTASNSSTQSHSATHSLPPTRTATRSSTRSASRSRSAVATASLTVTHTAVLTATATLPPTPSVTRSNEATATGSVAQSATETISLPGTFTAAPTMTLSVSQTLSRSKSPSVSATITPPPTKTILPTPPPPPPPLVNDALRVTTESMSLAVGTAGSVTSAGAAAQMSRTLGVMELAAMCAPPLTGTEPPDYDDPLPMTTSVLGISVGAKRGGYLRGAVVGNVGLFFALTVVALIGAVVIGLVRRPPFLPPGLQQNVPTKIINGLVLLRFPSCMYFAVLLLQDGIVSGAIAAVRHGDPADSVLDAGIAALAAIFVVTTLGGLAFVVLRRGRGVHAFAGFVPYRPRVRYTGWRALFHLLWDTRGEWKAKVGVGNGDEDLEGSTNNTTNNDAMRRRGSAVRRRLMQVRADPNGLPTGAAMMSFAFVRYVPPFEAFLLLDAMGSLAVSAIKGTAPRHANSCRAALWLNCVVQVAMLICCVVMKPYVYHIKNVLMVVTSVIGAVSSILLAIAASLTPVRQSLLSASSQIASSATFVAFLGIIVTVLKKIETTQAREEKAAAAFAAADIKASDNTNGASSAAMSVHFALQQALLHDAELAATAATRVEDKGVEDRADGEDDEEMVDLLAPVLQVASPLAAFQTINVGAVGVGRGATVEGHELDEFFDGLDAGGTRDEWGEVVEDGAEAMEALLFGTVGAFRTPSFRPNSASAAAPAATTTAAVAPPSRRVSAADVDLPLPEVQWPDDNEGNADESPFAGDSNAAVQSEEDAYSIL